MLITGNYLPGKNGGIENYTHWLATLLLRQHFVVEVAALNVEDKQDYIYENIPVHHLNRSLSLFEQVLKSGNFDICHFHEYSENGGIEIPWFKLAKKYCKKVFFTFHLPYLTCYKNDFRYKGVKDCFTFNNPARCVDCILTERINNTVGSIFGPVATTAFKVIPGIYKKLETKVVLKHFYLKELLSSCNEIFIIADWFQKLLFENGYINCNIHKIPNESRPVIAENALVDNTEMKKKVVFIGRIERQKGLHLLCKAMNHINRKDLLLDVYGNKVEEKYFEQCIEKYAFNYKGSVPRADLLAHMKEYDFLVLPSVFTEMFPIVIIDAFHHQLSVIASTAKGNKDVIKDGINGFLFEYDNAKDLAKTIDKAYQLKESGWRPEFVNPEDAEKEIEEILSYYK